MKVKSGFELSVIKCSQVVDRWLSRTTPIFYVGHITATVTLAHHDPGKLLFLLAPLAPTFVSRAGPRGLLSS